MTPNDIKQEVGTLAMENASEVDESAFWHAINRALAQVNRIRPVIRSVEVYNGAPAKLEHSRDVIPFGKKCPYVKTVKGCAAIYLDVSASSGEITVTGGGKEIHRESLIENKRANEYRILIPDEYAEGEITVTVTTPFAGVVAEAVYYSEKISDEPSDVPSGSLYNIFFFREIAPDLQSVVKLHYQKGGSLSEELVESKDFAIPTTRELWLLKSKAGLYRIYYYPKPTRLTRANENEEVPLDEDLQTLLPLLICYYVWLEDKPEIAEAMYSQYMQTAAEIRVQSTASDYPAVQDVYGW